MDELDAAAWQQRYDSNSIGWDRGGPSPVLYAWLDAEQLVPCRILIPGCGHGYEVLELAKRGFSVTAIDFAEAPVERLNRRLQERELAARIVKQDALTFQPDELFDAVYDQTFLCAIAPDLRPAYAVQLHRWLRTGGSLFAVFMQCSQLERPGPPFHCDLEDMKRLFQPTEWLWPEQPPQRVEHPSGLFELASILLRK